MGYVEPLCAAVFTPSAQLLAGWLLLGAGVRMLALARRLGYEVRRPTLAAWAASARALGQSAPYAAALAASSLLARAWAGGEAGIPSAWIGPWRLLALGVVPTSGCYLALHAGWRERRGHWRAARRQVRLGGLVMFPGTLALLVLVWSDLLFQPDVRRAVVGTSAAAGIGLVAGQLALGLAAFIGVLAALTGKPRPTAAFAALFYAAGVLALATTVEAARLSAP